MNRLEFLQKAGALTALASLGVSVASCSDDDDIQPSVLGEGNQLRVDLSSGPFSSLQNTNGWVLHPDENILLVNVDSEIRAFSSVCPHSQCTRNWQYSPGVFTCTCHNSKFDTKGEFLSGPANRGLSEIVVSREDDVLTLG